MSVIRTNSDNTRSIAPIELRNDGVAGKRSALVVEMRRREEVVDSYYDNVLFLFDGTAQDKSKYNHKLISPLGVLKDGKVATDGLDTRWVRIIQSTLAIIRFGANEDFTFECAVDFIDISTALTISLFYYPNFGGMSNSSSFVYNKSTSRFELHVQGQSQINFASGALLSGKHDICLERVGSSYSIKVDGTLISTVSGHTSQIIYDGAQFPRIPVTGLCNVTISRIRATGKIARYSGQSYTVQPRWDPYDRVPYSPYWDKTVFCFDGDVYNGLKDLTGRHNLEWIYSGYVDWDSVNRQTGAMYNQFGIQVNVENDDNADDFIIQANEDFTIDIRASIDTSIGGSSCYYGTLLDSTLWRSDSGQPADMGLIWIQNTNEAPQCIFRNFTAAGLPGMNLFADTNKKTIVNGVMNEYRFVRKNNMTRAYCNGTAVSSAAAGTYARAILLVGYNRIRFGVRNGTLDPTRVIMKRCRIVKAALCDPVNDLNYEVPVNYLQ